MRCFFRNCRGAVTVFVTLLIIPSILITGTGVDLARLYSARSSVRNANQLGANAVLASYDAVLQDLYGLFGVMKSDAELAGMIDTYIRASLFGQEITDAQMGELRLFWGNEGVNIAVRGFDDLSNVEILRRQIEEYAKWRAPVAIVADILDRLKSEEGGMANAAADGAVINEMVAIEDQLYTLLRQYESFNNEIMRIQNSYRDLENRIFNSINGYAQRLQVQIRNLYSVRAEFENPELAPEREPFLREQYDAIVRNINSIINGGSIGSNWIETVQTGVGGVRRYGHWQSTFTESSGFRAVLQRYENELRGFSSQFYNLISIGQRIDNSRGQLQTAMTNLENRLLTDSSLTPGMAEGMRQDINDYRTLLGFEFAPLARSFRDANVNYINNTVIPILQGINGFGSVSGNRIVNPSVSFSDLSQLGSLRDFFIDVEVNSNFFPGANVNRLRNLANITSVTFSEPGAFILFRNTSTEHGNAFEFLQRELRINATEDQVREGESEEEGMIAAFNRMIRIFNGLFDNDVSPGAARYAPAGGNRPASFVTATGPTLSLGLSEFERNPEFGSTIRTISSFLSGDMTAMDIFASAFNDLTNRALLVTYANEMFSNWTTRPNEGRTSMSGHPISPRINYFFRSELEFLFNGSNVAADNLRVVTFTILAIRLIANFASSYIIRDINNEIRKIANLVSLIPGAGKVLRFLVRPFYVFAESVYDVSRLRNGYAVTFTKLNEETWRFSLRGAGQNRDDDDRYGIFYRDYLTLFLLAGNPDVIAARIGNLIMLNVTNFNNGSSFNADVNRMAQTRLFDLGEAKTGFSVTTTIDLRFLFLSLPFAQGGEWVGVMPPRTFPVRQTDYRGY